MVADCHKPQAVAASLSWLEGDGGVKWRPTNALVVFVWVSWGVKLSCSQLAVDCIAHTSDCLLVLPTPHFSLFTPCTPPLCYLCSCPYPQKTLSLKLWRVAELKCLFSVKENALCQGSCQWWQLGFSEHKYEQNSGNLPSWLCLAEQASGLCWVPWTSALTPHLISNLYHGFPPLSESRVCLWNLL